MSSPTAHAGTWYSQQAHPAHPNAPIFWHSTPTSLSPTSHCGTRPLALPVTTYGAVTGYERPAFMISSHCFASANRHQFCTAISGAYIPPVRDTPAGVPIKSPIKQQPSNTHPANCDRLDGIPLGASCQTILSRYPGISVANLQEWNPFIVRPLYPCWLDPINDVRAPLPLRSSTTLLMCIAAVYLRRGLRVSRTPDPAGCATACANAERS